MAQVKNITPKIARDIASYIWDCIEYTLGFCQEIYTKMCEQRIPLSTADNGLHQAITDLMQEYCDGHGIDIEQLYKADYDEEYFLNTIIDIQHEHEERRSSLFNEDETEAIINSAVESALWKIYGRHYNFATRSDGTITDPAIVRDKELLQAAVSNAVKEIHPCQFEDGFSQTLKDKYSRGQLIKAAQDAYELWKCAESNFNGMTFEQASEFINAPQTALKELANNGNYIDFDFHVRTTVGITATIFNNKGKAELMKRCTVFPNPEEAISFGLQINY